MTHRGIPAAQESPEFRQTSPSKRSEGAGNAGRAMRPQPCVQKVKAHKHSHHGHTGTFRHSPRNGFTVSFVLFPGTGLSCPRRRRDAKHPRQLSASVGAPEPHDFAVRRQHRSSCGATRVHRIPRSTFVTMRNAPPDERGTGCALLLFLPDRKAKYFSLRDWTGIF